MAKRHCGSEKAGSHWVNVGSSRGSRPIGTVEAKRRLAGASPSQEAVAKGHGRKVNSRLVVLSSSECFAKGACQRCNASEKKRLAGESPSQEAVAKGHGRKVDSRLVVLVVGGVCPPRSANGV